MSIHKAKGLEFPIVVLVGMHAGTLAQRDPIQVLHDWSTGVAGIRLGAAGTLGGLFASEKLDARTAAEQRRLLYVGMTRAKERLVLSGALTGRSSTGNFLSLLRDVMGEAVGSRGATELPVGEGLLSQAILPADEGRPRERAVKERAPRPADDVSGFEARSRARAERWAQCRERPARLTPSTLSGPIDSSIRGTGAIDPLHSAEQQVPRAPTKAGTLPQAAAVGSLVHKMLESWNYRDQIEGMLEELGRCAAGWIPEELQGQSEEILKEARDVLKAFARSDAYAELGGVKVLGREVPFMMPWPGSLSRLAEVGVGGARFAGPPSTIMEGRIDLLYEKDGGLWVADYKTDRIAEGDIMDRMAAYRPQAHVYAEAVRQSFGRPPAGFTLIFLRLGKSVPVDV
jgi:ATP-dependent helicase/nuclease subunit A